jgi:hypothetical protein
MARTGGKRALVTICIGGGQGIAAIFEPRRAGRCRGANFVCVEARLLVSGIMELMNPYYRHFAFALYVFLRLH